MDDAHRLAVAKRIGFGQVPEHLFPGNKHVRRLAEMEANLLRSLPGKLESAEHLVERKRLWEDLYDAGTHGGGTKEDHVLALVGSVSLLPVCVRA